MSAPDYKAFARWCIKELAWGVEIDGGDIQGKAVEYGILREVPYDPERHGPNDCDAEPGDSWFEFVEPAS